MKDVNLQRQLIQHDPKENYFFFVKLLCIDMYLSYYFFSKKMLCTFFHKSTLFEVYLRTMFDDDFWGRG